MRKREVSFDADRKTEAQFVKALARGLDLLRAFRRGDPPLGNLELARRTGLPKATISRLTYTLSGLGYLDYSPDTARYTLSVSALALGFTALGSFAVRNVARPHMQALADETGGSVALGTRAGTSMVYIELCRGDSPVQLGVEMGIHIRMDNSAMGRAYLAALGQRDRDYLMARIEREVPGGGVRKDVAQATAELARQGFVLSLGDWRPGVNAVGVPLVLGSGPLTFALNCGGPDHVLTEKRLVASVGPRLAEVAGAIRAAMGQKDDVARGAMSERQAAAAPRGAARRKKEQP